MIAVRFAALAALALAAVVFVAACHPEAYAVSASVDPTAAVKAAAAEFDRAQLRRDRATIERYLASDFVFVRGSGVVADRHAFIAAFTDPKVQLEPFVVEHPIAMRLADGAVIIGGETTLRGTENGEAFAEHIRYADVFQLREGRWQVVYTQVTMMK